MDSRLSSRNAKAFILGGKATVTVKSTHTGRRFTYRVNRSRDKSVYFVSVLRQGRYDYIGLIGHQRDTMRITKNSALTPDALSVQAFRFTLDHVINDQLPSGYEVWHHGQCCVCGRQLTVPESIAKGIGPVCASRRRYRYA